MDVLFLLRSYGDFIIALQTVKDSKRISKVEFIASKHLESLYNAIPAAFLPADLQISFYDFNSSKNIFRCFTNRYFLGIDTIKELLSLRTCLQQIRNGQEEPINLYLEQKKRRLLPMFLTGCSFKYVIDKDNVYRSYAAFFQSPVPDQDFFALDTPKNNLKILVIVSARVKEREIQPGIIEKISATYQPEGGVVKSAFFRSYPSDFPGHKVLYHDFKELVALILDADLVIGPDSMPVHLCQLFQKPHYILHPAKVKNSFFTPFALQHHCHFSFEELATRQSFLPDSKS